MEKVLFTPLQSVCGFGIIHTEEPRKAQDNKQGQGKDNKMDKDNNKIVAVKCEGCFTEWYSPFYKEPYNDNEEYRDYYNEHIIDKMPVLGPSLGDSEDDNLIDDLQCHAERMCVDSADWQVSTEDYKATVEMCLADGKPRVWRYKDVPEVKITPYTRENLPPVNEKSLEVYGDFKELVRERVAAITR